MQSTSETVKGRRSAAPDWLTTPIEFEEQRSFRVSRNTLRVAVVLATVVILWAAMAPIRELSLARGQLVPLSQVRPVQHLEGGIVEEILVQEGEVVEKDQPLMRLQASIADSDLMALRARAQNLSLLRERLEALLAGRMVDFTAPGEVNAALAGDHRQAYQRRVEHRAKERHLLQARIAHRKAEIASLQIEIVTQRKLVEIQEEQLTMRRVLSLDGNMSRKQVLDVETTFEQSRVLLQIQRGQARRRAGGFAGGRGGAGRVGRAGAEALERGTGQGLGRAGRGAGVHQEACRPSRAADRSRSRAMDACSTCCSARSERLCAPARRSPASSRSAKPWWPRCR